MLFKEAVISGLTKIVLGGLILSTLVSVSNYSYIETAVPSPIVKEYYFSQVTPIEETEPVRGIYAPGWQGITKKNIDQLFDVITSTNMNTLMINVKNARGELFYEPTNELAREIDTQAKTRGGFNRNINMDYLLEKAEENDVRLIARHVMFWDNNLYKEKEDMRLVSTRQERWVDMRNEDVINYNLALLEEEAQMGFDEIVLDYIRFPDVNKFGTQNQKCEVIDQIVERASEVVWKHNVDFGVQVFGYTAWHHLKAGVGQRIQTLDPHVDYIYPMLYPSLFWDGSFGFEEPADHPGEILTMGYNEAIDKVQDSTKIKPMIQAFWYSPEKIAALINTAETNGMSGYVCWNPQANYSSLESATKKTVLLAEDEVEEFIGPLQLQKSSPAF